MATGFYAAAPSLAGRFAPKRERELPYRDETRYWLVPWKQNERSAARFAREALQQAGPDGVIAVDSTAEHCLLITQRLDKLAPGVTIQYEGKPLPLDDGEAAIRSALAGRTLYCLADTPLPPSARLFKKDGQVLWQVGWAPPEETKELRQNTQATQSQLSTER